MIDYSHDQGVYIPLEQVDFLYCIYCNATPWLLGGFCCDKSTCTYLQKKIIQFNSIQLSMMWSTMLGLMDHVTICDVEQGGLGVMGRVTMGDVV